MFYKRHVIDYSKQKKIWCQKKHCLALIAFLISKYNHENDKTILNLYEDYEFIYMVR
jgi:hypothetical protein